MWSLGKISGLSSTALPIRNDRVFGLTGTALRGNVLAASDVILVRAHRRTPRQPAELTDLTPEPRHKLHIGQLTFCETIQNRPVAFDRSRNPR
jgi:hypothetical protein